MQRWYMVGLVFSLLFITQNSAWTMSIASYTVTDLGFAPPLGGSPRINNHQQIAGGHIAAGQTQALIWENGVITNLGVVGGPFGINNAGQIVGLDLLVNRGFLWQSGTTIDLGPLSGDRFSIAFDINNNGQAVGISQPSENEAFIWQSGVLTGLNILHVNFLGGINDTVQIVGQLEDNTAFLWESGSLT